MVICCSPAWNCISLHQKKRTETEAFLLRTKIDDMIFELRQVFGRSLAKAEQQDVADAFILMDEMSSGKKLPRVFQMRSALDVLAGKNLVVRAGTGSGKTLAMALPMLLRPQWIFVTIAPLMALQNQHVSYISFCS